MTASYRVFGMELSPYSVKVRSYFRYKRIAHEWIVRTAARMEEFQRWAKLPLVPLVVTPDDTGLQDSTPLIEQLETAHPTPALQPDDPAAAFFSALLEEYADEWGNKAMFHFRWTYPPDQNAAAERIAQETFPELAGDDLRQTADALKTRMIPRLRFVGSSAATREQIERSFARELAILEAHLASRPFVFGGRPALADFGLFAQLYECSIDPTPGARMRAAAPRVLAWIDRMLAPAATGEFEPWEALEPTLAPLLRDEVAGLFLPWSSANARALAAGEPELTVTLEGQPFTQQTQRYHAKSLGVLRARYAAVPDKSRLDPVLERTGCRRWLADG